MIPQLDSLFQAVRVCSPRFDKLFTEFLESGQSLEPRNEEGFTVAHYLAGQPSSDTYPSLDYMRRILDSGVSTEIRSEHRYTLLHFAAESGNRPMVQLLIERGADLRAVNADGDEAIGLAAWEGRTETIRALLDAGVPLDAPVPHEGDRLTLLHAAASNSRTETVQLLLDRGADPNEHSDDGNSALHYAVRDRHSPGQTGTLRALLAAGAWTGAPDAEGSTALHRAVSDFGARSLRTALYLLAHDRDPCVRDMMMMVESAPDGHTPLHAAADCGFEDGILLLLACGADINARDVHGNTPLHLAHVKRHLLSIAILEQYGANAEARNAAGLKPGETRRVSAPAGAEPTP